MTTLSENIHNVTLIPHNIAFNMQIVKAYIDPARKKRAACN